MAEATPENTLGRRVREERLKLGLSQAQLADAMKPFGFNFFASTINKIENREVPTPRVIRLDEAAALAQVLGVPLMALYEDRADTARAHEKDMRQRRMEWKEASEALQKSIHNTVATLFEIWEATTTRRDPVPDADVKLFQQMVVDTTTAAIADARKLIEDLEGLGHWGTPGALDDGIVKDDRDPTTS